MRADRDLDVLVIGAGQAGLALGYHLLRTGLRFEIVDAHERVGDSWRQRFESLVLFTPRSYSALPGLPMAGDPDGYPTKDEAADYLERYSNHFDLPIRTGIGVVGLERDVAGFNGTLSDGSTVCSPSVVVASGAFQRPRRSSLADGVGPDVAQFDATTYRNARAVPPGTVLVVGDGATGRQIALELAATHRVVLSTGRSRRTLPTRILGRSVFWWLDRTGLIRASRESFAGKRLMRNDPFPGRHLRLGALQKAGIRTIGRVDHMLDRFAALTSGEQLRVDAVIWATGYADDTTWMAIPEALDAKGSFMQERGIAPVPGLFFVGRNWQWTRGSALVTGVGDDAAYVTNRVAAFVRNGLGASPVA